jgi:hypothetical protein
MTGGATALWLAIGHYTDGWTAGLAFHAWGACLQQGHDPERGYARTWGYQTAQVLEGAACGPTVISGVNSTDSPLKARGPGSALADHTLLKGRHRQRLPIRRMDGRQQPVRMVRSAQSEESCRRDRRVHTALLESVILKGQNTMKLTLDHTQRLNLNLHALLGAQRADVGSIRAIRALQDKIALDALFSAATAVDSVTGGIRAHPIATLAPSYG